MFVFFELDLFMHTCLELLLLPRRISSVSRKYKYVWLVQYQQIFAYINMYCIFIADPIYKYKICKICICCVFNMKKFAEKINGKMRYCRRWYCVWDRLRSQLRSWKQCEVICDVNSSKTGSKDLFYYKMIVHKFQIVFSFGNSSNILNKAFRNCIYF